MISTLMKYCKFLIFSKFIIIIYLEIHKLNGKFKLLIQIMNLLMNIIHKLKLQMELIQTLL